MDQVLAAVAGLLLLAMLGAGFWRARRRAAAARRQRLGGPGMIDEAGFVEIGGIPQWVSIRGEDRTNPVLVMLHGGPGACFQIIGYDCMRRWERDFTVVQWDQRGSGRTFGRNGPRGSGGLTIDRIAGDAIEVIAHALARTGHEKAVVLGASWGSIIGLEAARRRPGLVHAYVGAGQVVDMQANEAVGYQGLMARLQARGATKAAERLRRIGPPPYAGLDVLVKQRRILMAHAPDSERGLVGRLLLAAVTAPGARLRDVRDWLAGQSFTMGRIYAELMDYADRGAPPASPVPLVIIQGDEDIQTPTSLARAYHDAFAAPSKAFVLIPGGGHNALLAMPEAFHAALVEHVRPLAGAPAR
ncbi:MAG: alpha/beta hydrolase [Phenylobacterium zucineum]|nr:MAG: alpha/beta hydrolase [Phenylobacterium zucineum]